MPVRMDAPGTSLSRSFTLLAGLLVLLPLGCFGPRKPVAARGRPDLAVPLPRTEANEPPPEIKPPPPPLPGKPTGMTREHPDEDGSPLKRLALRAVQREKDLNNYIVRIRRQEQ